VYLAVIGLLAVAGATKVIRPSETAIALRATGWRWSPTAGVVRAAAMSEVAVAVLALTVAGPVPAMLVTVSYAAFSIFVTLALLRKWPLASCGCLGKADTAPSRGHVGVNVGGCLTALWWAVTGPAGVIHLLGRAHAAEVVLAALSLLAMALLVLTNPLAQGRRPVTSVPRGGAQ
jgi:hypothetical protein